MRLLAFRLSGFHAEVDAYSIAWESCDRVPALFIYLHLYQQDGT